MIRRLPLVVLLTGLLGAAAGAAELGPRLAEQGFEHLTFDGKRPNHFTLTPEGTIRVESDGGVSLIQRPVAIDLQATPILSWQWRVERGVPPTDLTRKGGDDRSLAIYVTFPFRPEEASLFERMKRRVVETFAGQAAPGRVITYVFGGQARRGEVQANPWFGDAGATIVLRPADSATGQWFEERVDLAADYQEVFGSPADDPTHLAVSADGDDTASRIRAEVAALIFGARR